MVVFNGVSERRTRSLESQKKKKKRKKKENRGLKNNIAIFKKSA